MKNKLALAVRDRMLVHAAVIACAAVAYLTPSAAFAAPFTYVANQSVRELDVIDMADFKARLITKTDEKTSSLVTNEATGKAFFNTSTGVTMIDAASNTIAATIPVPAPVSRLVVDAPGQRLYAISDARIYLIDVRKKAVIGAITLNALPLALVADEDGERAYALTSGRVHVIDVASGAVVSTIAVDSSATTLAVDHNGAKLYVASSGINGGTAALTIIDAEDEAVEKIIPTAGLASDLHPNALTISSEDERVYVFGGSESKTAVKYLVFDTDTQVARGVVVPIPAPPQPLIAPFKGPTLLSPDGKYLYVSGAATPSNSVIAEIDTSTETTRRILSLPTNGAEYHYVTGLASSNADDRFVIVAFIFEHRIHSAGEPRSVGFIDVASNTTLANVQFPQQMWSGGLFGAVLDPDEE